MRWRFLEINSNFKLARFLAVQREGEKPEYDPNWRRFEDRAREDGLFEKEVNSIGNRHGDWREGAQP